MATLLDVYADVYLDTYGVPSGLALEAIRVAVGAAGLSRSVSQAGRARTASVAAVSPVDVQIGVRRVVSGPGI